MSRCRRIGSDTRSSPRSSPIASSTPGGKEAEPPKGKGRGMANRPGETCAREDIMKRNPSVGRKLPVTWLRQHAIVSGIIKHIGSICPWKRNTLSPRAIQEPSIDLCSPDRSGVRSLSLLLPLSSSYACIETCLPSDVDQPSPNCFDGGSVALRDRTGRERLLPDDRNYWLYQPQPVPRSGGGIKRC